MMRKKWFGWLMVIFGIDALTPPYPSPADTLLWLILGKFTGTNNIFKELIIGFNPFLWRWDTLNNNFNIVLLTAILVYGLSFIILLRGIDIVGNKSYLAKLKNKMRRFFK